MGAALVGIACGKDVRRPLEAGDHGGRIAPADLRCVYSSDPLGIDTARPRLSWALTSEGRAVTQGAFPVSSTLGITRGRAENRPALRPPAAAGPRRARDPPRTGWQRREMCDPGRSRVRDGASGSESQRNCWMLRFPIGE